MQIPDEGVRGDLVICSLCDNHERAAALGMAHGKLEQDHCCIAMTEKIDTFQSQGVEHLQQFFRTFDETNWLGVCFVSPIHDDTACLAECAYLAGVDEFEVFEDGYEDEGVAFVTAEVDQGHSELTYCYGPP